MASPRLVAALAALWLTGAACAQDVITRSKKDGNAKTTTIIPVEAPKVTNPAPAGKAPPGPLDPPPGEAKGEVVTVKSWICGTQFTDDKGQTWTRVMGPREASKPDKLAGWKIRAKDGKLIFVTVDGAIFVPTPAGGPVAPAKPPIGAELMKQLDKLTKELQEEQKKQQGK
jgi:hypothetical protein